MKRYDTVIWDLDGTLLDTLDDLGDSVNAALEAFGCPRVSREKVRLSVGNGVRNLVRLCTPTGDLHPHFEEIAAYQREFYTRHSCEKTHPYAGLPALLCALRENGVKMGVVSNKVDCVVKELVNRFFADTVTVAVGERENIRRKPAPDSVFEAMRVLGADPASTVYIGDSEVDIETAKNAGLPCISVTWGFRDPDVLTAAGAQKLIPTVEGLRYFFEKK